MLSLTHPSKAFRRAMQPSCISSKAVTKGIGVLGIVLFAVALITTITLLPDITRYVRIKTM